MLSISETKRAAAASAAARGSRDVVKRFLLFRSSEDSFFQVVSLYVVGKDLYELHSRRAIVQWVSCNLYQSGRIVFPCNVRQRPDIAFDRPGLQIVFFCDHSVDLLVNSLDTIRLFEDDLDRPDQLRTARVVVGDAKGPQKIEQDIFQIQ